MSSQRKGCPVVQSGFLHISLLEGAAACLPMHLGGSRWHAMGLPPVPQQAIPSILDWSGMHQGLGQFLADKLGFLDAPVPRKSVWCGGAGLVTRCWFGSCELPSDLLRLSVVHGRMWGWVKPLGANPQHEGVQVQSSRSVLSAGFHGCRQCVVVCDSSKEHGLCRLVPWESMIIAIVGLQRGIPSKRESSARVDYVPALCTHRLSLLPSEWSGEVFGLQRRGHLPTQETSQPEVGSSGGKSTTRRVVSGNGSRRNGSLTSGKGLALRAGHGGPEPVGCRWTARAALTARAGRRVPVGGRIGNGPFEASSAGIEQSTQNKGCSPWRPDVVMSTSGRGRHSILRIFKCRRGHTGHHATCSAHPAAGPYLRLSRFQGFAVIAVPSYSSGPGHTPTAGLAHLGTVTQLPIHPTSRQLCLPKMAHLELSIPWRGSRKQPRRPTYLKFENRWRPDRTRPRAPAILREPATRRVGRRCHPQGDPTNQLPCALRVYLPADSHTCQTPWSVFQDGPNGEPAGRRPEHAGAHQTARASNHNRDDDVSTSMSTARACYTITIHVGPCSRRSMLSPFHIRSRHIAGPHPLPSRQFQALFDSLCKVLFIFPPRYLFVIGLSPVFSLGRNLPPEWGCIPKQPDSLSAPRGATGFGTTGLSPSLAPPSRGLGPGQPLRMLLQTTIRTPRATDSHGGLFPVRSPLLGESLRPTDPHGSKSRKAGGGDTHDRSRALAQPPSITAPSTADSVFNQPRQGTRQQCARPRQACPRPNGFGRNLRSKTRWFTGFCNSHQVSHFATFFIDARAKISIAESRSPIETLLRLLLPLNDKVQWTSHNIVGSETPTSPQSEHFTGPFNRQIAPPTKNGHAPPPIESRKSSQSVNPYYVRTCLATILPPEPKDFDFSLRASGILKATSADPRSASFMVETRTDQNPVVLSHANLSRAYACFEHSNFLKVTASEARPRQLRPGAHCRQKGRADRCTPMADRSTQPKVQLRAF
ncbi:hypothetical protein TanjilG_27180 [Lupinus angustifolius]|uniref:Uncharacterized protein n=1 Tax=Lupinus angustifolius TaxID=3871 RepID=A0A4P1QWM0_LUPAN|nr:hypothetical protein TanjilG_27180 [Lupinus angustifolius]